MNQMLMLLLSLIALEITDVGEKAKTKRGDELFYTSDLVKAPLIKSPEFLSIKYKCLIDEQCD